MKRLIYIFSLLAIVLVSCEKEPVVAGFEDTEDLSIYDYLMENKEEFSSFIAILEKGGIDKTLGAYNPDATGYTLFLPDNDAVNEFIDETQQFSSLNDILNDDDYVSALSRYHVVSMGVRTNEFPFGAFPEPTLSKDYLTVSFIIETDTSYYKINNQAAVIRPNIEVSNGYIHVVENVLEPVVFTSYDWIEQNPDLSIFKDAIDLTGIRPMIDLNLKEPGQENLQPVSMLVEPDHIFNQSGINSVEDLAEMISPDDNDYTNPTNPLYNFMAYHVLSGMWFLDDFEGTSTNYTTLADIPLNINGRGVDILINKGKQVFDSIIVDTDTTYIDYIGIFYDNSNVITRSGAIHFIDRIMEQQIPTRSTRYFQFYEEPLLNSYRQEGGTFLIEDQDALNYINWSGADLFYVDLDDPESSASNGDYLEIDGDFTISYTIPKIVQGRYRVGLRAEAFNSANAVVEVFIDGKKLGGITDLSTGGSPTNPFQTIELGTINFNRYIEHVIEIRPLIPGRFLWDYIRFVPY